MQPLVVLQYLWGMFGNSESLVLVIGKYCEEQSFKLKIDIDSPRFSPFVVLAALSGEFWQ